MQFSDTIDILGINFFNGNVYAVVRQLKKGGLLVVPAAPALSNIKKDVSYYNSLLTADIVIADSGYMALIWNLFHKKKINRISGLKFLMEFLNDKEVKTNSEVLLVNPNKIEADANLAYLSKLGFNAEGHTSYLAPLYTETSIEDEVLLNIINEKRPKYIIINLGGGTQEKLGAYLKQHLSYSPGIICTGAAISFLTGQQAKIPVWADKLYMGWFYRCAENPKLYIPRYFKAFKLAIFIFRYSKIPRYPVIGKHYPSDAFF
jgi:N-acetylglucosaminyldiphosphoundecaprenol N-acetyl-beta-D-mannosaminyltransferase